MFKFINTVTTNQEVITAHETVRGALDWLSELTQSYGVASISSAAAFKQAVNQLPQECLRTLQIQEEDQEPVDIRKWLASETAKAALKDRYHSESFRNSEVRSPSMRRRHLRSAYQVNHNELEDLNLPLPAESEFKVRGSARRNAKATTQPRSWKSQTKARSQWARHMEGPCRCYTAQGESGDALLLRLAKEGLPVVLAN